jgi:hypothetical protein
VTYLDTSCFVKLYYPEPDSAKLISLISGKTLLHTALHDLEFRNALQLKIFFKSGTVAQAAAACRLVEADLKTGVLTSVTREWREIFAEAATLADKFTATTGCRSLDVLHCAAAKVLGASEFVSTESRQKGLAGAMGLKVVTF